MGTGRQGTFAIAWSDTEIDGLADAPLESLAVGASWSWYGEAVRVDGRQDILVLHQAWDIDHLREHARAQSGRTATGFGGRPNHGDGRLDPDGPLRDGFTVTDGRRQFPVAILREAGARQTLLAFPGEIPAPGAEHWITSVTEAARRPVLQRRTAEICFTGGTRLRTPSGDRKVEDLLPGDLVSTRDSGAQEVLWVGHSRISGARLHLMPDLRPVRLRAEALDTDIPDGELIVSPHHRVLVRGRAAMDLFGTDEVLVAARDLLNDRTITVARGLKELRYYHLLLTRHELVWANGVPTESFHPAEAPLERLDPGQRGSLYRLFPHLAANPASYGGSARRLLTSAEAAILRHGGPARRH